MILFLSVLFLYFIMGNKKMNQGFKKKSQEKEIEKFDFEIWIYPRNKKIELVKITKIIDLD